VPSVSPNKLYSGATEMAAALSCSPFLRLAGLSGATAVALGAYGAHSKDKSF